MISSPPVLGSEEGKKLERLHECENRHLENGEDREFGKRDGLPRVLADADGGNFFTL